MKYGMKYEMLKVELLALPLTSFDIRPLNLWVSRPLRQCKEKISILRRNFTDPELSQRIAEVQEEYRPLIESQPVTVGQLVEKFRYRFPGSKHSEKGRLVSLGDEPINKLKRKLIKLGLTPDDWPALAPHGEILEHLSKVTVVNVPIRDIFPKQRGYDDSLHRYLGCSQDDVSGKTVQDFIQVDPCNIPVTEGSSYYDGNHYFRTHKRKFLAVQQKLVEKGFTEEDGAFFRWNPTTPALKKARKALRKYGLAPSELKKFARIVVSERWIV